VQFGGKVFIIGVGKIEQVVRSFPTCYRLRCYTHGRFFQFPFMHLSANEIDVGFLYRYANQVWLGHSFYKDENALSTIYI
jgi:L-iditol 2-dehydrogenase